MGRQDWAVILEGPGEEGGITEKEEAGAAAEQLVQNVELRGPNTKAHDPQEVLWSSCGGLVTKCTHTVLAAASGQSLALCPGWVSGQGLSRLTLDCRGRGERTGAVG